MTDIDSLELERDLNIAKVVGEDESLKSQSFLQSQQQNALARAIIRPNRMGTMAGEGAVNFG